MTQAVATRPERAPPVRRAGAQPARARPDVTSRPALRLASYTRSGRVATFVVLATIFTLVSAVVFHVMLAQGQLRLDGLSRDISTARREYEVRRLETSMLASPQRIIQEAQKLGLVVPPDPPTYLEVPGAKAAPAQGGETATTLGDWKKVKPHLGDPP
jgi:cell division protein FtsL